VIVQTSKTNSYMMKKKSSFNI